MVKSNDKKTDKFTLTKVKSFILHASNCAWYNAVNASLKLHKNTQNHL